MIFSNKFTDLEFTDQYLLINHKNKPILFGNKIEQLRIPIKKIITRPKKSIYKNFIITMLFVFFGFIIAINAKNNITETNYWTRTNPFTWKEKTFSSSYSREATSGEIAMNYTFCFIMIGFAIYFYTKIKIKSVSFYYHNGAKGKDYTVFYSDSDNELEQVYKTLDNIVLKNPLYISLKGLKGFEV